MPSTERRSTVNADVSLVDRIDQALVEAMKARDAARTSALRLMRAALQNRQIELRSPLGDADVLQVLSTLAKQRRESIEQFRAGGRADLVEKELAELAVLREFLPEQMSDDELRQIVAEVLAEVGAQGPRDLGKAMSAIMPRVQGRADGRKVNAMVRDALTGGEST